MYIVVLVLGFLAVAVGVVAVGFGLSIKEFSFGTTLLISGTAIFVGGLVVVAVAAAIRELHRIAETLSSRQAPRAARAGEHPDAYAAGAFRSGMRRPRVAPMPMPAAPFSQEGPAPAAEEHRSRESMHEAAVSAEPAAELTDSTARPAQPAAKSAAESPTDLEESPEAIPLSPNAAPHAAGVDAPGEASTPSPEPAAEVPPAHHDTAADARSNDQSGPPQPSTEHEPPTPFDAIWPPLDRNPVRRPAEADVDAEPPHHHEDSTVSTAAEPDTESDTTPAQPSEASPRPHDAVADVGATNAGAAPAEAPYAVSILKSGIVDGMAYTLYSDGSIEAELPTGTIRFESIGALRAHLEQAE